MATGADGGPNPARAGTGLVAKLRQGEGHDRLYNTYASQLYRYCWTLVGPEGADEAVYHAMLSAVRLIDELEDSSELRPWLFALARSACQQHGFRQESPYVQLATGVAERPMVEMASRLPLSASELLELHLRHGLAPSQIARIHGLDPEITGELCHAAVRRAADVCAERAPEGDDEVGHHIRADHANVSEVLALLEPPAPSEDLHERTVRGCADPAMALERAEIGATMAPLDADGFPLQRDRSKFAGEGLEEDSGDDSTARVPPVAATSIADVPSAPETDTATAHESEPASEVSRHHTRAGGHRRRRQRSARRRWPLPATSGLVTVGVALAFWGVAVVSGGGSNDTAPSDAPDPSNPQPAAEGSPEPRTAEDDAAASEQSGTPSHGGDSENPPEEPQPTNDGSAISQDDASEPSSPEAEPSSSPDNGNDNDTDGDASAEDEAASEEDTTGEEEDSSPEEDTESDDDSDSSKGPISEWFDGIFNPDS